MPDRTLLAELQQHIAEHTPSCNARTDHLLRRAAWALGAPRPAHIGGNAEDCPGCEGTNPPYPFICPGPTTQPDRDPQYRDDTLDLLHVDPTPDTDAAPCHWTDCALDEGHDNPHPTA